MQKLIIRSAGVNVKIGPESQQISMDLQKMEQTITIAEVLNMWTMGPGVGQPTRMKTGSIASVTIPLLGTGLVLILLMRPKIETVFRLQIRVSVG